jgi:signal transduction histidine kinase
VFTVCRDNGKRNHLNEAIQMNLRRKTILIITVSICAILLATLATSQFIVLAGFQDLEQKDAQIQVTRAADSLNRRILDLDIFTNSYGGWDDTYQFVLDNNTEYIESNANEEALKAANLNLISFVDSSGQVVFSTTYNLTRTNENTVYSSLANLLSSNLALWNFSSTQNYTRGIVNIDGTLFLLASRPILTSQFTGPIRGAVLMGVEVTTDLVKTLQDQTHLNIEIAGLSDKNTALSFQEARTTLLRGNSAYVNPINSSLISVFTLLNDVSCNPIAVLRVNLPRSIYDEGLSTINTFLMLNVTWIGLFGVIMFFNLERSVLSRITRLTDSVGKVKEASKIEERGVLIDSKFNSKKDELSSLSLAINSMLDRLQEMTGKLQKSQRLAAVGEFSVMIAHDLRNPLQSIKIANDCLKNERINTPEKKLKMVNLIGSDITYCEKIVNDLLSYSGNMKIIPVETDIKSVVTMSLSHVQVPENVKVEDLTQSEPKIKLDVEKMARVFDNLIKNAVDAMADGGHLKIQSVFSDNRIRLTFADTGKGIEKEHLNKLFTPLFTTKAKGMGFGLAICQRIVEAHKGTISVESTLNQGTTFIIELPINI